MNWDQLQGKWKQFRGAAKQRWGELTDDDWDKFQGRRDMLAGRLQELYGISREEADQQLDEFARNQGEGTPRH